MADTKSQEVVSSSAILQLFPVQGEWREGDYFSLPGNRLVELVRGCIEVLPMPSMLHQFITRLVFLWMNEFVERNKLGIVMQAPTRVKIEERHFREPDVLFVATKHRGRYHEQYWESIDLAVEVVSPDAPDRDLIDKRNDYARAGIPEYWIIDPRDESITVLQLVGQEYKITNGNQRQSTAKSFVLDGFSVDARQLFLQSRSN